MILVNTCQLTVATVPSDSLKFTRWSEYNEYRQRRQCWQALRRRLRSFRLHFDTSRPSALPKDVDHC